jgi:hypothetical protein
MKWYLFLAGIHYKVGGVEKFELLREVVNVLEENKIIVNKTMV